MANIKSQIKRIKTNRKSELANTAVLSKIKTYITKFNKAAESKDKEPAEKLLKKAIVALDKAAGDNIIHPNNAANKKSSIMKRFNLLSGAKPEEAAEETKPAKKAASRKATAKKPSTKAKANTKKS